MDAPIRTARLVLMLVEAEDADELAVVFADERLYAFTGEGRARWRSSEASLGRLAGSGPPIRGRSATGSCAGSPTGRRSGRSRRSSATAELVVTDETRTTDKHEHVERLWRRDLSPDGRLDPALR